MGKATFEGDFYMGYEPRECGEHRSTGSRAWCHQDSEWCYPELPCRGCEIAGLREDAPTMIPVPQLRAAINLLFPDDMTAAAKRVLESICEQHEGSSSDKDHEA